MATYVIGDIQGCFQPFTKLLEKIAFNPQQDTLWLAGDLVNRGPDNLRVLRFCRDLGDRVRVILGNHDLHLLAASAGVRTPSKKDTIDDVLNAPDKDELLAWLRSQPLIINHKQYTLSHAGIPHIWSCVQAEQYANEVEAALKSDSYIDFLRQIYGNTPNPWQEELTGYERLRVITNYLTRMRFIAPDGSLDFNAKNGPENPPLGMQPWFAYPRPKHDENRRFLFGHWASLEGHTGQERYKALDTGCVWGRYLTAYRLEDEQKFRANYSE